jgi:hypothetical protein
MAELLDGAVLEASGEFVDFGGSEFVAVLAGGGLGRGALLNGFRAGLALECGNAGLVDFCHEAGDELEAREQGSGFRARDAALAGCVDDLGCGDEDGAFIEEGRKGEGLALAPLARMRIEMRTRSVVMAEGAAGACGGLALCARVEGVSAFGRHGFSGTEGPREQDCPRPVIAG